MSVNLYPSTTVRSPSCYGATEGDSRSISLPLVDAHGSRSPLHGDEVKAIIYVEDPPNATSSFSVDGPAHYSVPLNSPLNPCYSVSDIPTPTPAAKAFNIYRSSRSEPNGHLTKRPLSISSSNIARFTSLENFSYSSWDEPSDEALTSHSLSAERTPFPIHDSRDTIVLSPMTFRTPTLSRLPKRLDFISPQMINHAPSPPAPRSSVFSPGASTPPPSLTKCALKIMSPITHVKKRKYVAGVSPFHCDAERLSGALSWPSTPSSRYGSPRLNSVLSCRWRRAIETRDFRTGRLDTPSLPIASDFPFLSPVPSLSAFASPLPVRQAVRSNSSSGFHPAQLEQPSPFLPTNIGTLPPPQSATRVTAAHNIASPIKYRSGSSTFTQCSINFSEEFLHESLNILSPIAGHSHEYGRDSVILPYHIQSPSEEVEMLTTINLDAPEPLSPLFSSPTPSRSTAYPPATRRHLFGPPPHPPNPPTINPSIYNAPRSQLLPSPLFDSGDDLKLRALDDLIRTFSEDIRRLEELRARVNETHAKIHSLLVSQHGNITCSECVGGGSANELKCTPEPASCQAQLPPAPKRSSMIPVNTSRSRPMIPRLSSLITSARFGANKSFTNVTSTSQLQPPLSAVTAVGPTGISNTSPIPYIRRQLRKPVGAFVGRFGFGLGRKAPSGV